MRAFGLSGTKLTWLWPLFFCLLALSAACSLLYTRPVQDMSDTTAALRAAKEQQADVLAPELYREAQEWFYKARIEYKLKEFDIAQDYARRARRLAEQAEFEVLRGGGKSMETPPDTGPASVPPDNSSPDTSSTYKSAGYATPTGTPIENIPPPGLGGGGGSTLNAGNGGGANGSPPPAPNPAPGP